jgi:hypothetical protein
VFIDLAPEALLFQSHGRDHLRGTCLKANTAGFAFLIFKDRLMGPSFNATFAHINQAFWGTFSMKKSYIKGYGTDLRALILRAKGPPI